MSPHMRGHGHMSHGMLHGGVGGRRSRTVEVTVISSSTMAVNTCHPCVGGGLARPLGSTCMHATCPLGPLIACMSRRCILLGSVLFILDAFDEWMEGYCALRCTQGAKNAQGGRPWCR